MEIIKKIKVLIADINIENQAKLEDKLDNDEFYYLECNNGNDFIELEIYKDDFDYLDEIIKKL